MTNKNLKSFLKQIVVVCRKEYELPKPRTKTRCCFTIEGKYADTIGYLICLSGLKKNLGKVFIQETRNGPEPLFMDTDFTLETALDFTLDFDTRIKDALIDFQIFADKLTKKWSTNDQIKVKLQLLKLAEVLHKYV